MRAIPKMAVLERIKRKLTPEGKWIRPAHKNEIEELALRPGSYAIVTSANNTVEGVQDLEAFARRLSVLEPDETVEDRPTESG